VARLAGDRRPRRRRHDGDRGPTRRGFDRVEADGSVLWKVPARPHLVEPGGRQLRRRREARGRVRLARAGDPARRCWQCASRLSGRVGGRAAQPRGWRHRRRRRARSRRRAGPWRDHRRDERVAQRRQQGRRLPAQRQRHQRLRRQVLPRGLLRPEHGARRPRRRRQGRPGRAARQRLRQHPQGHRRGVRRRRRSTP
jgi:hypothetical protein